MRAYNFEYTNRFLSIALLLLGLFVAWPLFVFVLVKFFVVYTGPWPFIIITVLFPFAVFWLVKKKCFKQGSASISADSFDLRLHNLNETIRFDEIESYMVQIFKGTLLKLKLKDGRKIRIQANDNFCNPKQFDVFCTELEATIEQFKSTTKTEVVRQKSFFDKKGTYYFLVVFSIAVACLIVFAVITGKKVKIGSLLLSLSALGSVWAGYLGTKARKHSDNE